MRFRYKVLMMNAAILAVALGILGFIMIYHNFNQTLDIQNQYAIEENNLLQASVQYQLLDVIGNGDKSIGDELINASKVISRQLLGGATTLYVKYGEKHSYCSNNDAPGVPNKLYEDTILGSKSYITQKIDGHYYIYVCSHIILGESDLYFTSMKDITETYQLLINQIRYFVIIIILVLVICGVLLYLIGAKLTKPLEQLNTVTDNITNGDYSTKLPPFSDDEVGMLAEKFNQMTVAIATHVDELNDMIKQREQFVADFTHEIKTPMTAIIGYADTLRKMELPDDKKLMAYQYIYNEGKRLESLSMKLFDLIYLRDNDNGIELAELDTETIGEEVSNSMKPLLARKDITLETDIESSPIYGELELLKTLFINLIDNARKASEPKSKILFRGFTKEDSYCFQVIDHGCGMDEETILHICDEFYMADKSRSRTEGGAGLGMSLAAIIVARHNAKLDIESKLGEGTTMTVTFLPDI